MPTLLNLFGFKFFFYANDHPPPHIHVIKGERWAKIELLSLKMSYSNLKPKELKQALEITLQHQSQFLEKWHEWFNTSND